MRISTGTTPISEVDIGICPTNLCKVVAAANDDTLGPHKIFYSSDCGLTWHLTTNMDAFQTDHSYIHPSIDWTSNQRVWLITVEPSGSGTSSLRCYYSDDTGETWNQDRTFLSDPLVVDQPAIQSPRMWIDSSPDSPFRDTIYLIWGNNNSVYVKSRNPHFETWRSAFQLDSQSTGLVSGCDIKTDNITGKVGAFWHDTGSKNLFVSTSIVNNLLNGSLFEPAIIIASTIASSDIAIPSCASHKAAISISAVVTSEQAYVVWVDLAEASGCDSASSGSVVDVASSCKTRVWFAKSEPSGWIAKPINTGQSLNDEFHPRLFQDAYTGTLVVVYYDTIDDPGRRMTDVWMKTSEDQGKSWSLGDKLTSGQTNETISGANNYQYGDYLGISGQNGFFFAAWTDRRGGLAEQIWAKRFRIPPIAEPCGVDPILTSAKITFNTTTQNKDHNSLIEVTIKTIYTGEYVGYLNNPGDIEFTEHSSNQYPLTLEGFWITRSRLQRGSVKIDFVPTGGLGNDKWKFNFSLDFTFTNGDSMHLETPSEITLTGDTQTTIFDMSSLI
jgi:hypothetical protein